MDNSSKVILPLCLGVVGVLLLPALSGLLGIDLVADVRERPATSVILLFLGIVLGWAGMGATRFGAITYKGYKDKQLDQARYRELEASTAEEISALKQEIELLKSERSISAIAESYEVDGAVSIALRRELGWRKDVL